MSIESFEKSSVEKEQSPEEIRSILEQAFEKGLFVNLVIKELSSDNSALVPKLIVEELDEEYAMMTYLDKDGKLGELGSLSLSRIKKAELIENN